MKAKYFYLLLSVFGLVSPFVIFMPWIVDNGVNLSLMIAIMSDNMVAIGTLNDLLVTAVAACAFIIVEGRRIGLALWWVPLVAALSIGPCFGLPLFLYMRERKLSEGFA